MTQKQQADKKRYPLRSPCYAVLQFKLRSSVKSLKSTGSKYHLTFAGGEAGGMKNSTSRYHKVVKLLFRTTSSQHNYPRHEFR